MPQEPSSCHAKQGEPHFYGGQAVIEGVMMRGKEKYAVAVRREDGEIVLAEKDIVPFSERHPWAKWPFVRGNVSLFESLILGFSSLQFSADVLAQEENERVAAEKAQAAEAMQADLAPDVVEGREGAPEEASEPVGGIGPLLMGLTTAIAFVLAIALFILLPTWVVDWFLGKGVEGATYGDSVIRNLVEGCIRLAVITLYILTISLMTYVKRVFQFHGAEHATINCLEAAEEVTQANCMKHATLHPRCGTAFLLVVIVVKVILGSFFGWPVLWLRMLIRLALLPIVAGIAYEVIRWAGRRRDSLLARALAGPGMLMQMLTTRRPDESQVQVAMYALGAVAPEFNVPADWPTPRRVPVPLHAAQSEGAAAATGDAASD